MLGVLMQPEIDGISLHNLATLAGGLYVTTAKNATWCVQRDENNREYPYVGKSSTPVAEVGPAGPVFRLYTEALMSHPLITEHAVPTAEGTVAHGKGKSGQWHGIWGGTLFYETGMRAQKAAEKGTPPDQWPEISSMWESVVALSAKRDSVALLMVNTHPNVMYPKVHIAIRLLSVV